MLGIVTDGKRINKRIRYEVLFQRRITTSWWLTTYNQGKEKEIDDSITFETGWHKINNKLGASLLNRKKQQIEFKGTNNTSFEKVLWESSIEVTIEAIKVDELPKGESTELAETEVQELSLLYVIAWRRRLIKL